MQADVVRYFAGDRVPVEVLADGSGDAPSRGDGVRVRGESEGYTQVELVQGADGEGVAILLDTPPGYDSADDGSYSDGESLGVVDALLVKPVINVTPASGYSPAVGDLVQFTKDSTEGRVTEAAGVTATGLGGAVTNNLGVDGSGNLETDNASDIDVSIRDGIPFGEVFATRADDFNQGDAIGVAVHR